MAASTENYDIDRWTPFGLFHTILKQENLIIGENLIIYYWRHLTTLFSCLPRRCWWAFFLSTYHTF